MVLNIDADVHDPEVFTALYHIVQHHGEVLKTLNEKIRAEHDAGYQFHLGRPAIDPLAAYYDPILDHWCFL